MTTTLSNLIDEVLINLAGYTFQQERSTYLTQAVTTLTSPSSNPTILSLGSTQDIGKGVIEIDEELIWVDSFDRVANTATIAPYGRGYLGTTATTHALDTKVSVSPIFPRFSVKRAINDTIGAVGTQLMAIKNTTFTWNAAINTYGFNDLNIDRILRLEWQNVGPSQEWIPIRRWDFDSLADETVWGSGAQTITIGDYVTAGRTVKVTYITQPTTLANSNDDFQTVTGLPATSKDVIVLGSAYRLLSFLDPARAGQLSPQADETDGKRPYNASGNATKQLYALYIQRLNEEIKAQQGQFPLRVHYSR